MAKHLITVMAFWGLLSGWKSTAFSKTDFPVLLTSQYAKTEKTLSQTGVKNVYTAADNNITFNARLPGFQRNGQQVSMNYNWVESTNSGTKSTATNLGLFMSMAGKHYSLTNNYSQVETQAPGGGLISNRGVNMSASMAWPKLPSINVTLTSFEAGGQNTESSQLSAAYRLGRTSLNFNNVETTQGTLQAPQASTSNRTLSVNRQHLSSRHLMVASNLSVNRQRTQLGDTLSSSVKSDALTLSIYDSHVKAVPLNMNIAFQRNDQSSGTSRFHQAARNINAFTSVLLPARIRSDFSYNISTQSETTSGLRAQSRTLNVTASRRVLATGMFTVTHTRQRSDTLSAATSVKGHNTVMTYSAPVLKTMTVTIQKGTAYQSGSGSAGASSFTNVRVISVLRGGITSSYQYQTSKTDSRITSENLSMSLPVNRTLRITMDSSRKKTGNGRENTLGMNASFAVTPSMTMSTTFSRQKANGKTVNDVWGTWVSYTHPGRVTIGFGISTQKTVDANSVSTTLSLSSAF